MSDNRHRGTDRRVLSLLALLLATCAAGCSPTSIYVEADRATYDVIAPAHRAYVLADPALSDEARQRRIDLLNTWDLRIRKAEGK